MENLLPFIVCSYPIYFNGQFFSFSPNHFSIDLQKSPFQKIQNPPTRRMAKQSHISRPNNVLCLRCNICCEVFTSGQVIVGNQHKYIMRAHERELHPIISFFSIFLPLNPLLSLSKYKSATKALPRQRNLLSSSSK